MKLLIDAAIATLRELNDQAAQGWPNGFDLVEVNRAMFAAGHVLAAASTSPELARWIHERLDEVEEPQLAW